MDLESIEIVSMWEGEPKLFADSLLQLRFIVEKNNDSLTTVNEPFNESVTNYFLNDWRIHNPWAAEASTRSDKSRFSRLSHVCPDVHAAFLVAGRNSITKEEYQKEVTKWKRTQNGNGRNHKEK